MNTPLLTAIGRAWHSALSDYLTAYWAKPQLDLPTDQEAATLIQAKLAAWVLDWRRVEDGRPDADETVFVAVEGDEDVWQAYIGDRNRWCGVDGMPLRGRVYAWAPSPAAPDPRTLVGFKPRHHATSPAPALRKG